MRACSFSIFIGLFLGGAFGFAQEGVDYKNLQSLERFLSTNPDLKVDRRYAPNRPSLIEEMLITRNISALELILNLYPEIKVDQRNSKLEPSLIELAISQNNPDALDVLLSRTPNLDLTLMPEGRIYSPLDYAILHGNKEVFARLLTHVNEIDFHAAPKANSFSLVEYAIFQGRTDILKLMLKKQPALDVVNPPQAGRNSILKYAISRKDAQSVKLLLSHVTGETLSKKTSDGGQSIVEYAQNTKEPQIVQMVEAHQSVADKKSYQEAPSILARAKEGLRSLWGTPVKTQEVTEPAIPSSGMKEIFLSRYGVLLSGEARKQLERRRLEADKIEIFPFCEELKVLIGIDLSGEAEKKRYRLETSFASEEECNERFTQLSKQQKLHRDFYFFAQKNETFWLVNANVTREGTPFTHQEGSTQGQLGLEHRK